MSRIVKPDHVDWNWRTTDDGVPDAIVSKGGQSITPLATYATDASGNIAGLANQLAYNLGSLQGFSGATTIPEVLLDLSPGGQYVFTQYDGTYGQYMSQLSIGIGLVSSLTKTAITATLCSALKKRDGTALTSGGIMGAWWVSETRFLFAIRGLTAPNINKQYLYLCNYNGSAWTVGNNAPALDNSQAVLDLGLWSGGQAELAGVLFSRSIDMSSTRICLNEYNVASGRVSGSTSDAVRLYTSLDGGLNWEALLTFNTSGNQIRHGHACRYDGYADKWYFSFGDLPDSAIVRWDGISAPPPANTELYDFWKYPGWEVIKETLGIETRTVDFSVHPQSVYYMCDINEESSLETYAFHIGKSFPMLRTRSNGYVRPTGRSPAIQCEMPNGGAYWMTDRGDTDLGEAPELWKGYSIYYTPDGVTFSYVARTRDVSSVSTGFPWKMFITPEGTIVISGFNGRGCKLRPSASTNGEGSIVATPAAWDGATLTLQGDA